MKLEWLVESIEQKTAVTDCDQFLYRLNNGKQNELPEEAAPSPASKRNILSMSGSSGKRVHRTRLNFDDSSSTPSKVPNVEPLACKQPITNENAEDQMIDQYLNAVETVAKPSTPKQAIEAFKVPSAQALPAQAAAVFATVSGSTESESQSEYSSTMPELMDFLANLKVYVTGFDDESHDSLVNDCTNAGAEIIFDENYKGKVDYMILPIDYMTMDGIKIKAKHLVNHNWLVSRINYCCLWHLS